MRPRCWTAAATFALTLGVLGLPTGRADEPPAPPVPIQTPDPAQTAALARAEELEKQVEALYRQAKYAEAIALAREALAVSESGLGPEHPETGTRLNNVARLLRATGDHAGAKRLLERALAIAEKAQGPEHPSTATRLNNLAVLLQEMGDYAGAKPLCERALAIAEKAQGPAHPLTGTRLNNLAFLLQAMGDYAGAKPLFERALAIAEKAEGPDHPSTGTFLNNLALLLQDMGDYAAAKPRFERALAIAKKTQGPEHALTGTSMNNLALLLQAMGDHAGAKPLFERALAIAEKAGGPEHPSTGARLNSLASLLQAMGDYAGAKPLYKRALALAEKAQGPEHPETGTLLNNLAVLLRAMGDYAEAKPLFERALAIAEKAQGPAHPWTGTRLSNLALLLQAMGDYAGARPLYERALAIAEKAQGPEHPATGTRLNNLALLLQAMGDYAGAKPLYERSLAIAEKAQGPEHPETATRLNNLARLLQAMDDTTGATALYERALAITEVHARAQLGVLGTRQRLGLLRSTRYRLDAWLLFASKAGRIGYAEVLRFRGLVARAETAERVLARHAGPEEQRLQSALAASQNLAARLANEMPPASKAEARARWQRRYAQASAERERLTTELSRRSAPLRGAFERLDLGLEDIQAQLGPEVALVDVLRVADRYLAWIVRASGEPVRVNVGAADAIEEACREFVQAIATGASDAAAGGRLRSLVWAKVETQLGAEVRRVVLVPDAALAAVPFAALPGKEAGRHLLDDLALSYVMNAQDLVPWKDAAPLGTGALLVGGVDYQRADVSVSDAPPAGDLPTPGGIDRDSRGGSFDPIPQTRLEAEGLGARLGAGESTLLLGAEATEARLRAGAKGKRLLHIATHGFAREDLLAGLYNRRIEDAWLSADAERQLSTGHDPMLLSGLALAGANPRDGGGGDDGILTALEASYLDLDGVDLVTLSACNTAKGTAESGEGVQGLVSAFQMAGARHVLASLWKVDDEATRLLMEGVYERLLRPENPLSPADALRESALALRDLKDADGKQRFAAPRYWAAFVAYGR